MAGGRWRRSLTIWGIAIWRWCRVRALEIARAIGTMTGGIWLWSKARSSLGVGLDTPQCPCSESHAHHYHQDAHVSYSIEGLPPGAEGRSHTLKESDQYQGRGETSDEAIYIWFQRGKVKKSRAS